MQPDRKPVVAWCLLAPYAVYQHANHGILRDAGVAVLIGGQIQR